jgi:hypothetical protein
MPLLSRQIHLANILSLFALPLTASTVYAAALSLHLQWHTNWILYLITTPLGFLSFGVALLRKNGEAH